MQSCNRPGGFEITERALALCALPGGAAIADIGCGSGATVRLLTEKYGFDATGVDVLMPDADFPFSFIRADAARLPFTDSSHDGLFFECSMSKMELPDAVLSECARVLRHGGRLIISDLYARGEAAILSGRLGRLERREDILARLSIFGFELLHFEDYSDALLDMWASLVFEEGSGALFDELGADADTLRRIRCGYFLAVLRLDKARVSRADRQTAAITGALSPEELRGWQLSQLREAVSHAKTSAFYGERLRNIEITDFASFESLPFTSQGDIAGDGLRFLTVPPSDVRRIVTLRTSGTTGPEKRLHFTRADVLRTEEFFTYALSDYTRPGESAAVFMSSDKPDGIGDLLRRALRRIGVETKIHGIIVDYSAAVKAASGKSLLVGLPSQMLRLCRTHPMLSPKTVLLSADYIPEAVIAALKKTWNCNVIRHFGMTETCFGGAVDCSCGAGQHIRHADFYIEIIDPDTGEVMPHGKKGEIVLTTLRSDAFPLIRYRTGDLGVLEDGKCACGGVFPRLGRVFGRIANLKQRVNIHALDEAVFAFGGVLGYQAHFDGTCLHLTVDGGDIDGDALRHSFGVPVQITYAAVEETRGKRTLDET